LAISDLTPDPKLAADLIRQVLGAHLPELSGGDILRGMAAEGILTFLQVLKKYPANSWSPAIKTVNFDRIRAAQESGGGVILWVAHAFHGHLAAKIAFHNAGLRVSHLSHPTHGFSSSHFGIRYLNRLQTTVEDPYLAERVLLPLEGQNKALHILSRRLRANGIVSITGQRGTGRTVETPFLSGIVKLAPGAPALGHMTGAAVLPVFAFRNEHDEIEVTVEPAIEILADAPRDAAVALAVRNYAAVLERYVLRYPRQWLGWVQL
jgi:lauroyl/myristoyl acyltransferase